MASPLPPRIPPRPSAEGLAKLRAGKQPPPVPKKPPHLSKRMAAAAKKAEAPPILKKGAESSNMHEATRAPQAVSNRKGLSKFRLSTKNVKKFQRLARKAWTKSASMRQSSSSTEKTETSAVTTSSLSAGATPDSHLQSNALMRELALKLNEEQGEVEDAKAKQPEKEAPASEPDRPRTKPKKRARSLSSPGENTDSTKTRKRRSRSRTINLGSAMRVGQASSQKKLKKVEAAITTALSLQDKALNASETTFADLVEVSNAFVHANALVAKLPKSAQTDKDMLSSMLRETGSQLAEPLLEKLGESVEKFGKSVTLSGSGSEDAQKRLDSTKDPTTKTLTYLDFVSNMIRPDDSNMVMVMKDGMLTAVPYDLSDEQLQQRETAMTVLTSILPQAQMEDGDHNSIALNIKKRVANSVRRQGEEAASLQAPLAKFEDAIRIGSIRAQYEPALKGSMEMANKIKSQKNKYKALFSTMAKRQAGETEKELTKARASENDSNEVKALENRLKNNEKGIVFNADGSGFSLDQLMNALQKLQEANKGYEDWKNGGYEGDYKPTGTLRAAFNAKGAVEFLATEAARGLTDNGKTRGEIKEHFKNNKGAQAQPLNWDLIGGWIDQLA